jgi:hypothetical protein
MTQNLDLICVKCKNFTIIGCPAFPESIPDEILLGENDHSKIIEGQIGKFIFDPIDEDELLTKQK